MKNKIVVGRTWRINSFILIALLSGMFINSCDPVNNNLGEDIFPPSDTILVYTDTISGEDLELRLVQSPAIVSSVSRATASSGQLFLLGSMVDTLTGISKAEIVTQMCITSVGVFGDDPVVDSLSLFLYFSEVEGDTTSEMHIMIHEFLDTIDYDSVYYSDYDVTGKYDMDPLVDEVIIPKPGTWYEFLITDEDFFNRILAGAQDTLFQSNTLFQDEFLGLYMTTEQVASGGAIAKVQLSNSNSGMQFKYLHDSVLVDTADYLDYGYYGMTFHEWYSEKINIFHHDYTGTTIGSLIDVPDINPSIAYVQGMAGVNVELRIPEFETRLDSMMAINRARIVFYVVPDSLSGISVDDYPQQLMLSYILPDGSSQIVYDYLTSTSSSSYGKLQQSNEVNAFSDPLYYYSFEIGRQMQSVLSEDLENTSFRIYMLDNLTNPKAIKFWSNLSGQKGGLKLELVYTKF